MKLARLASFENETCKNKIPLIVRCKSAFKKEKNGIFPNLKKIFKNGGKSIDKRKIICYTKYDPRKRDKFLKTERNKHYV